MIDILKYSFRLFNKLIAEAKKTKSDWVSIPCEHISQDSAIAKLIFGLKTDASDETSDNVDDWYNISAKIIIGIGFEDGRLWAQFSEEFFSGIMEGYK